MADMTVTGKAIRGHRVSGGSNRESGCSAIGNQVGLLEVGQPGAAVAAQQQKAKRYRRIR